MTITQLQGDCRDMLKTLPDVSVQSIITSPPYYGLRDYGMPGQIGLEPTPGEYVQALVSVFREARRVLKDTGTLWLNLGDSYASDTKWGGATSGKHAGKLHGDTGIGRRRTDTGLPDKSLMGIPWRVAFALQDDGWILRSDIIWHKPNAMPESVKDRPTRAHEYVFLFSKQPRYYYDADAISEPASIGYNGSTFTTGKTHDAKAALSMVGQGPRKGARSQLRRAYELAHKHRLTQAHFEAIRAAGISDTGKGLMTHSGAGQNSEEVIRLAAEAKQVLGGYYREFLLGGTRNKRTVWDIPTRPYADAHFAVMPEALVEPCILASSRQGDTILDPFGGTGTVGRVALKHQRQAVLIELNPTYIELQNRRTNGVQLVFE